MNARSRDYSDLTEELANALQTALLLSTGFERALVDTHWAREAAQLRSEIARAAEAAIRLRDRAQGSRVG